MFGNVWVHLGCGGPWAVASYYVSLLRILLMKVARVRSLSLVGRARRQWLGLEWLVLIGIEG